MTSMRLTHNVGYPLSLLRMMGRVAINQDGPRPAEIRSVVLSSDTQRLTFGPGCVFMPTMNLLKCTV